MPSALSQLSPEILALIASGVSVQVASRDHRLRPSVMRAIGHTVDAGAGTVTVFISRRQGGELLRDLAAGGPVAIMFSQPSTHRTVQLKAARATLRGALPEEAAALDSCVRNVVDDIAGIGFPRAMAHAIFAYELEDLVAVTCSPEEAFEQTPGPRAGERLAEVPR